MRGWWWSKQLAGGGDWIGAADKKLNRAGQAENRESRAARGGMDQTNRVGSGRRCFVLVLCLESEEDFGLQKKKKKKKREELSPLLLLLLVEELLLLLLIRFGISLSLSSAVSLWIEKVRNKESWFYLFI